MICSNLRLFLRTSAGKIQFYRNLERTNRNVKAMVNSEILKNIKSFLTLIPENLGLREAYLFGSYAKGLEKESSDVDVALVFDRIEDFFQMQQELRKLRRKVDLRIEPHPLKSQDFNSQNPFAKEIQETGILIV